MKIARIWADEAGESHYEDREVPYSIENALGKMSDPIPVTSMILRENEPGYDYDWHIVF